MSSRRPPLGSSGRRVPAEEVPGASSGGFSTESPVSDITNPTTPSQTRRNLVDINRDISRVNDVPLAALADNDPITPVRRLGPVEEEYRHDLAPHQAYLQAV